jgi:hypothetical protein
MYGVQTTSHNQTAELDTLLRDSLRRAVRVSRLSPAQIADELTKRVQRPIKDALVYAWTAETKHRWHLPADVVPPLCDILGDDNIQRLLLSEKLRKAVSLGESAQRVVSLLHSALQESRKQMKHKRGKKRTKR